MKTLADAWEWYENTARHLGLMKRLAVKYWINPPWMDSLENDPHFDSLDADTIAQQAVAGLAFLDDLAVMVMFSVFEAEVRHTVLEEVAQEGDLLRHRVLKRAMVETKQRLAEGSFFHVLNPYKDVHADLVEEVNQVRRYRNWVAHGRQGTEPDRVRPRAAYDRLNRFLAVLQAKE